MKKIAVIVLPLVVLFATAMYPAATRAPEKVIQVFHKTFGDVKSVKWFLIDREYYAYFLKDGIINKIIFNEKGRFLRSRRELSVEHLPLSILCQVREKYNGKNIRSITEITEGKKVFYALNVEDDNHVWVIEARPNRKIKQIFKFKKQLEQ